MSAGRILALTLLAFASLMVGGAVLVAMADSGLIADGGRLLYRLTCHGLEHRSFFIDGAAMPICARCTGIWGGMAAASALVLAGAGRRPRINLPIALIAVGPLVVDGVTQALGLRESFNLLRVATGLPAGMVWTLWALQYLRERDTVESMAHVATSVNES